MADIRACDQCGTEFAPRREHGRFCSADCRTAWHRGDSAQATVSLAALDWSVTAMTEVTSRLAYPDGRALALLPTAATAVSDATWWVTLVDATLVRHEPLGYDAILGSLPPQEREEIEQVLAGLRYVRNQMVVHISPADFLQGKAGTWAWSPLPEPAAEDLSPRGPQWERGRYLAYQEWLAGRSVTRTFTVAARFLRLAATSLSPQSSLTA